MPYETVGLVAVAVEIINLFVDVVADVVADVAVVVDEFIEGGTVVAAQFLLHSGNSKHSVLKKGKTNIDNSRI